MALLARSLRFGFALSQCTPLTATWNVSRVQGDCKKEASIGEDKEEEKDRVYYNDANR